MSAVLQNSAIEVISMESYKREFIAFLQDAGVLKFGDFTAKSGRKIPYFINAGDIKTGDPIAKVGEFYVFLQPQRGEGSRRRRYFRRLCTF